MAELPRKDQVADNRTTLVGERYLIFETGNVLLLLVIGATEENIWDKYLIYQRQSFKDLRR